MPLESLLLSPAQMQMSKNTTAANNESLTFPVIPVYFFYPLRSVLWSWGSKLENLQTKWFWGEREEPALSESPTKRQLCKIALPCESLQLLPRNKTDVQNVSTGIAFVCFYLSDNRHISKLMCSAITMLYHTDSSDMFEKGSVRWRYLSKS